MFSRCVTHSLSLASDLFRETGPFASQAVSFSAFYLSTLVQGFRLSLFLLRLSAVHIHLYAAHLDTCRSLRLYGDVCPR